MSLWHYWASFAFLKLKFSIDKTMIYNAGGLAQVSSIPGHRIISWYTPIISSHKTQKQQLPLSFVHTEKRMFSNLIYTDVCWWCGHKNTTVWRHAACYDNENQLISLCIVSLHCWFTKPNQHYLAARQVLWSFVTNPSCVENNNWIPNY